MKQKEGAHCDQNTHLGTVILSLRHWAEEDSHWGQHHPLEGVWGKRREDLDLSLGLWQASEGWNSHTRGKIDPFRCLTTSIGERPIQCVNSKQGGRTSLSLAVLMYTELSGNSAVDKLTAAYTVLPLASLREIFISSRSCPQCLQRWPFSVCNLYA